MATVTTSSCVPSTIEAGSTVRFTASNSSYPETAWTMQFALNDGVNAPLIVSAEADGTGFIVTLSAAQTATLKRGRYTWGEIYTALVSGEKASGNTGTIDVLPSLTGTNVPTNAEKMVTLLRTVMEKFGASDKQSVSFNGQSFSRFAIADYQRGLTYWEARVIREQNELAGLRGNRRDGSIGVVFVPSRASYDSDC